MPKKHNQICFFSSRTITIVWLENRQYSRCHNLYNFSLNNWILSPLKRRIIMFKNKDTTTSILSRIWFLKTSNKSKKRMNKINRNSKRTMEGMEKIPEPIGNLLELKVLLKKPRLVSIIKEAFIRAKMLIPAVIRWFLILGDQ